MLPQHSFGTWLRLKRKAQDLTREGLAARVSCSAETIRKIENEERRPSAQIVTRLAEIFNVPTAQRENFLRFARGDWKSGPANLPEDYPWDSPDRRPRTHVPATTNSLIGRENQVADLLGYLKNDAIRFITLVGPPGIGKTRLSLELARKVESAFQDGVFFAPLASLVDPSLVAPAILQALGYVESKKTPPLDQLRDGIGERNILLILDNCEHLIDEAAAVISTLLQACFRLKIIATSREAFRISGEWQYPVPPLALPLPSMRFSTEFDTISKSPALLLFSERARAVRADFILTRENVQAVAAICNQLDGLPLALELMAARIRLMSPQALLDRMTDTFVLSADGMRAVSARQKTLNNAIAWSFNSLSEDEQKLFSCCAVFSGGFDLNAAESIFPLYFSGKPVLDLLSSLADKSLLNRTFIDRGELCYDMLITIRQFASSNLRRLGLETPLKNDHLGYYLHLAEQGEKEMRGPNQTEWLKKLGREQENFRAALEWSVSLKDTERALRLLHALGWPWEISGHYRESRNWFEKIRILPGVSKYPLIYAHLLNHIGRQAWLSGNFSDSHGLLAESLQISGNLGDEGQLVRADTLNWLGLLTNFGYHDLELAKNILWQAHQIFEKYDDLPGEALTLFHLGLAQGDGNDEIALSYLERSLSLFEKFGDLFFIARVSLFLGFIALRQHKFDQASEFFSRQLNLDLLLQNWEGISDGWESCGLLHLHLEHFSQAQSDFEECLMVCREHDLVDFHATYYLGLISLQQNRYLQAEDYLSSLVDKGWKEEGSDIICGLLFSLACVASGKEKFELAAQIFATAQKQADTIQGKIFPFEQKEVDRHIERTRVNLGETNFETFYQRGCTLTVEQAIELIKMSSKS